MWNEPHPLYGWNLERNEMKGEDMNEKPTLFNEEGYSKGYADGYAKAIDEFLEEMEKWNSQIKFMRNESAFFTIDNVREVAEQLKGVQ